MFVADHLRKLASEFDELGRQMGDDAGSGRSGDLKARFTGLVLRAETALKDHLGPLNSYAWRMQTLSPFMDSSVRPTKDHVSTASAILLAAAEDLALKPLLNPPSAQRPAKQPYVSPARIAELQSIRHPDFDTTRLVQLCRELNIAHEHECHMAVAALVRTIIHHVPSVFGCKNFEQFANNQASRSLKPSMMRLQEGLKNIADRHLHVQMRPREVVLLEPNVRFYAELGELLGEVCRVLKNPATGDPNAVSR